MDRINTKARGKRKQLGEHKRMELQMGTNLVWVPLMFLPSSVSISTPPSPQTHTPALPLQALLPSLASLFSSPKSSFYLARSEDGSKGNGRLQCIKGIVRQKRSFPFQWESQRLRGGSSSKPPGKLPAKMTAISCPVRGRGIHSWMFAPLRFLAVRQESGVNSISHVAEHLAPQ